MENAHLDGIFRLIHCLTPVIWVHDEGDLIIIMMLVAAC